MNKKVLTISTGMLLSTALAFSAINPTDLKVVSADYVDIEDNIIWRSLMNNNVFSPSDYPSGWEQVGVKNG